MNEFPDECIENDREKGCWQTSSSGCWYDVIGVADARVIPARWVAFWIHHVATDEKSKDEIKVVWRHGSRQHGGKGKTLTLRGPMKCILNKERQNGCWQTSSSALLAACMTSDAPLALTADDQLDLDLSVTIEINVFLTSPPVTHD